jgi:PAS domain-containing protein
MSADIHDRKLLAEQCKQAADRVASVLGRTSEPFLALTGGEIISHANAAAERLLGRGAKELVGKRLAEVSDLGSAQIRDNIRQVLKDGRETMFDAHFKQLADGGRLKLRVLPNGDGVAIFFQGRDQDEGARETDGKSTRRHGG